MILTYIIDKTVMLTEGQGHKVKGQGHICIYVISCFGYISIMDDSILMIRRYMVDIDETLKLTKCQGQRSR